MFELKRDFSIVLGVEEILLGQGIDPARASPGLRKYAEQIIVELEELLEPAALFGTVPVLDFQYEQIIFQGGAFEGSLVARAMSGASELGLALCTIGPKLEQRVDQLMKTEPVKALALDGAGIAAVGMVALLTANAITNTAEKRGIVAGMQICPGQEGWPIEQQRTLFRILPTGKLNVRLTESCLMLPRKSITFVIPLGENICDDAVPCDFCSKQQHCRWRREKAKTI